MKIATEEVTNRVLLGLTSVPAPAGMEARIAARLLQVAEERPAPARTRNGWRLTSAAVAGTVLTVAVASLLLHHPQPVTLAVQPQATSKTRLATATPNVTGRPHSTLEAPSAAIKTAASRSTAESVPDYDAIALAETLAPSQAAATLPLTAEEKTLVQATRPGQPIEIAELDQAREPAIRAAAAVRERRDLLHYVSSRLAPLAAFQKAQPDLGQEDPQPSPDLNPQPQPLSPTASR